MGCLLSIKLKYEDYDWSELPDGESGEEEVTYICSSSSNVVLCFVVSVLSCYDRNSSLLFLLFFIFLFQLKLISIMLFFNASVLINLKRGKKSC